MAFHLGTIRYCCVFLHSVNLDSTALLLEPFDIPGRCCVRALLPLLFIDQRKTDQREPQYHEPAGRTTAVIGLSFTRLLLRPPAASGTHRPHPRRSGVRRTSTGSGFGRAQSCPPINIRDPLFFCGLVRRSGSSRTAQHGRI